MRLRHNTVKLGEVSIHDTTIREIIIYKNKIYYCCDDATEVLEKDVITIDDTDKLVSKIKVLMCEINYREEHKND